MLKQKPNVKKVPSRIKKASRETSFKEEFLILAGDVKKSAMAWLKKWEKFRDIVSNNYELGRRHLMLGNLKDAVLRFKFVLWMEPKHLNALYYLGVTYMTMGRKKEACDAFKKALHIKPDYAEARYLLAIASPRSVPADALPKKMPLTLAREYFDGVAPGYDEEQLEVLLYEGHLQLDNSLRSCLVPGRMDHVLLELGVGTGLCGPGLRDIASHMTGVDISPEMLAVAVNVEDTRGRKIYDALIQREAVEFLSESPDAGYDIVMSAGLFSYMGDLEAIFAESVRVLKDKGFLAFTADVLEGEGSGYSFDPVEARYRFSKAYLQDLAARNGLTELKFKDLAVYPNYSAWVCVYQK